MIFLKDCWKWCFIEGYINFVWNLWLNYWLRSVISVVKRHPPLLVMTRYYNISLSKSSIISTTTQEKTSKQYKSVLKITWCLIFGNFKHFAIRSLTHCNQNAQSQQRLQSMKGLGIKGNKDASLHVNISKTGTTCKRLTGWLLRLFKMND